MVSDLRLDQKLTRGLVHLTKGDFRFLLIILKAFLFDYILLVSDVPTIDVLDPENQLESGALGLRQYRSGSKKGVFRTFMRIRIWIRRSDPVIFGLPVTMDL